MPVLVVLVRKQVWKGPKPTAPLVVIPQKVVLVVRPRNMQVLVGINPSVQLSIRVLVMGLLVTLTEVPVALNAQAFRVVPTNIGAPVVSLLMVAVRVPLLEAQPKAQVLILAGRAVVNGKYKAVPLRSPIAKLQSIALVAVLTLVVLSLVKRVVPLVASVILFKAMEATGLLPSLEEVPTKVVFTPPLATLQLPTVPIGMAMEEPLWKQRAILEIVVW